MYRSRCKEFGDGLGCGEVLEATTEEELIAKEIAHYIKPEHILAGILGHRHLHPVFELLEEKDKQDWSRFYSRGNTITLRNGFGEDIEEYGF